MYNNDNDTEVVVVRYISEAAQVLDKRQIGLRTISTVTVCSGYQGILSVSIMMTKIPR